MLHIEEQADFFPTGGVPSWLPDESLFSLCSRYHVLSGNLDAGTTCYRLFGHRRFGLAHDFPSRLSFFAEKTNRMLGAEHDLALKHTVLPFYLPFRDSENTEAYLAAMSGSGIGSLKFKLGILTSSFGANHPLKFCLGCFEADQESHGVAYWHLQHQIPGSWYCVNHETALHEAADKYNGVSRFEWLLPSAKHSYQWKAPTILEERKLQNMLGLALAKVVAGIFNLPTGFHFDRKILSQTYHSRLVQRGLATAGRRLKARDVGLSYYEMYSPLQGIRQLAVPN